LVHDLLNFSKPIARHKELLAADKLER
jgi:hypothetical protein